jgi:hypothetical protein
MQSTPKLAISSECAIGASGAAFRRLTSLGSRSAPNSRFERLIFRKPPALPGDCYWVEQPTLCCR